jgi:hypothetical protein
MDLSTVIALLFLTFAVLSVICFAVTWWRVKNFALACLKTKKLWSRWFVGSGIAKALRVPFISNFIPALTAAYMAFYEFWGSSEKIFTDYPDFHAFTLKVLIAISLCIGLIKGFAESSVGKRIDSYIDLLHNFIRMNGYIVKTKDARFKTKASQLTDGEDVFLHITHPSDQINVILGYAQEFLAQNFNVPEEDLRFTIVEQTKASWAYSFDTQPSWQVDTTPAQDLLKSGSTAHKCYSTGEPEFLADKQISSTENKYVWSSRDERKGNGSVYCYPVSVNCGGRKYASIISIASYSSHKLVKGYDDTETKQVAILLKEICRRIELELTLKFIRGWKHIPATELNTREVTNA